MQQSKSVSKRKSLEEEIQSSTQNEIEFNAYSGSILKRISENPQ